MKLRFPVLGMLVAALALIAYPAATNLVGSETDRATTFSHLDAAQISSLMVLFVSWDQPTPAIPQDNTKTDGGSQSNDPGGDTGNTGGTTDPGSGTVTHHPEPATLISGLVGAGLLSIVGWRRRRQAA
jgi:hypothetical protein